MKRPWSALLLIPLCLFTLGLSVHGAVLAIRSPGVLLAALLPASPAAGPLADYHRFSEAQAHRPIIEELCWSSPEFNRRVLGPIDAFALVAGPGLEVALPAPGELDTGAAGAQPAPTEGEGAAGAASETLASETLASETLASEPAPSGPAATRAAPRPPFVAERGRFDLHAILFSDWTFPPVQAAVLEHRRRMSERVEARLIDLSCLNSIARAIRVDVHGAEFVLATIASHSAHAARRGSTPVQLELHLQAREEAHASDLDSGSQFSAWKAAVHATTELRADLLRVTLPAEMLELSLAPAIDADPELAAAHELLAMTADELRLEQAASGQLHAAPANSRTTFILLVLCAAAVSTLRMRADFVTAKSYGVTTSDERLVLPSRSLRGMTLLALSAALVAALLLMPFTLELPLKLVLVAVLLLALVLGARRDPSPMSLHSQS